MRRLSTAAGLSTISLVALLAAAGGCSSTPAATSTPSSTVINLGLPTSVTSFANADVAVAQAQGYFKAEGLTVNVKNLASGVPVVQGVVGGSLDIGASSFEPVANADAQGGDVVIIGAYTDRPMPPTCRWPPPDTSRPCCRAASSPPSCSRSR